MITRIRIELKSCPFCGAEAEIVNAPANRMRQIPCFAVHCKGCNILVGRTEAGRTEFFRTALEAADAWNRRDLKGGECEQTN